MQRWYCLQSERRKEHAALANITQGGFEAFLPVIDRGDEKNPPLFPSYLFVQFDRSADPWRWVNSRPGVRRLVSLVGDIPVPLPIGCVEELQDRAQSGEFVKRPNAAQLAEYALGESVRVTDGPWWSHQGLVQRSDKERVYILLSLFNRQTLVPVQRAWVESAA